MTFQKIAKTLVRKGDHFITQNGQKDFHLKARDLLQEAKLHEKFDYQDLIELALNQTFDRIEQNFEFFEFSDLPLTIARGAHCFIDLYFWRRRPTVIHNHHFAGAFQCLVGSNVDFEFTYQEKKKIGKFHALGDIHIHRNHQVKNGDVQAIAPLNKFIHQNHHHADLTVNLCFRSRDLEKNHLSNYLYSGLRFEKNPCHLHRIERIYKMTQIQDFNLKNITFSLDDALGFLIRTSEIESANKMFQKIKKHMEAIVQEGLDLKIDHLIKEHNKVFDQLLEDYE